MQCGVSFAGGLEQGALAAKIYQLTVKVRDLLFVQHLIIVVVVGDTRAAFQRQQRSTDSRHDSNGVGETEQLY